MDTLDHIQHYNFLLRVYGMCALSFFVKNVNADDVLTNRLRFSLCPSSYSHLQNVNTTTFQMCEILSPASSSSHLQNVNTTTFRRIDRSNNIQSDSVTIVDNLCNSKKESFERIQELSGREDLVQMFEVDLRDTEKLEDVFKKNKFDACIHFAALKAVGESVKMPLKYYKNNLTGTLNLLEMMSKYGCKMIVFSSSATVYGTSASPLSEKSGTGVGVTNPYGQTKHMMEQVLRDLYRSDPTWRVVLLRYFNPVGAHASGRIGEDQLRRISLNNLTPVFRTISCRTFNRLRSDVDLISTCSEMTTTR